MAKLSLRGAKGTGKGKSGAKASGARRGNTAAQKRGFKKALAMYPELFSGYGGGSGGSSGPDTSFNFGANDNF